RLRSSETKQATKQRLDFVQYYPLSCSDDAGLAGLLFLIFVMFVILMGLTKVLGARKSWSEIWAALGFLFLLPFANLHLLTYDRWYLQRGALRGREPLD